MTRPKGSLAVTEMEIGPALSYEKKAVNPPAGRHVRGGDFRQRRTPLGTPASRRHVRSHGRFASSWAGETPAYPGTYPRKRRRGVKSAQ